jgi:hypothetical protein
VKRKTLALTLLLVLLVSALAGAKLANQAEANPEHYAWHSSDIYIRIVSPENKTYRTNIIMLSVTSENNLLWTPIVDGRAAWAFLTIRDRPSLNLSDGSHTLIANAYASGAACVTFTIDTTAPNVSIASPENITYESFDVPLNFTVNESVSQITYSLDGEDNVTVAGNTTLTDLPYEEHNVTVYAQDLAGNVGASETIYFNISQPPPEPEPFPTTLVAVISVSVAVVCAGLLVYFTKIKKNQALTASKGS